MRARVKLVKKRDGEVESKWSSQINYQNVVFLLLLHKIFDFYSFKWFSLIKRVPKRAANTISL